MRKQILAAGLAAVVLIPSAAFAQQTCEQRSANRAVGTIAGAGIGALLGSAVAGHGDRTTGAVIGGVGGAIVGNQVAKGQGDCTRAYGFYDSNGMWHANAVTASNAAGYYDRDGVWVNGAPNGYYDGQGRWVSAQADASAAGYYDGNNRWIPASSNGYYDVDGRWVSGAASGHYDQNGRWVAGSAVGRYDASGRWMAGQAAGHRDANGVWIADAQPGYYDNGQWRAGTAYGYYDARGRWYATAPFVQGTNVSYAAPDGPSANMGFRERQTWLQTRIERGMDNGSLRRSEGLRALSELKSLRREEQSLRHYQGQLSRRDEVRMQAKLDAVNARLNWARGGMRRTY